MAVLREEIRRDLSRIVEQFRVRALRHAEDGIPPYLPEPFLSDLFRLVNEVAFSDPNPELLLQLLERAADYGTRRHDLGLREFPYLELFLLRDSFWGYIRQRARSDAAISLDAIVRIDETLAPVIKACIRGYYRHAFERHGEWPAALLELLGQERRGNQIGPPADETDG